ncbi:uncharacterized protein [Lepisosteus oculatus]|uniref:uncharacterized protein n=1 Tax=Lepisosteus oculatus TaxID=7918 RepID=UPI00371BFA43
MWRTTSVATCGLALLLLLVDAPQSRGQNIAAQSPISTTPEASTRVTEAVSESTSSAVPHSPNSTNNNPATNSTNDNPATSKATVAVVTTPGTTMTHTVTTSNGSFPADPTTSNTLSNVTQSESTTHPPAVGNTEDTAVTEPAQNSTANSTMSPTQEPTATPASSNSSGLAPPQEVMTPRQRTTGSPEPQGTSPDTSPPPHSKETAAAPASTPPAPPTAAPTSPPRPPSTAAPPDVPETTAPPKPAATPSSSSAELNVGDDSSQPVSTPPLDPLLAGLVSVFIITAVVVSLLLFLKFRQRRDRPEFRRLQDLPMDDMMEDTPLSMYTY